MEDLTTIQFGRYYLAVPTQVVTKVQILIAKGRLKKVFKQLDEQIEALMKEDTE